MVINNNLGKTLKQARLVKPLTLRELSRESGVSASHLGRVERGERFPSGHVLQKLARPLGFDEATLLTLAGFLSPQAERRQNGGLDPYVASVLAQEPVRVQRAVLAILNLLKTLAEYREAS